MTRIILIATIAITSLAGCFNSSDDAERRPDNEWKLVENHFFIERIPNNARDMIHEIAFVKPEDDNPNVGVNIHGSRFRLLLDVFTWQRHGERIDVRVLQDNKERRLHFKAWKCDVKDFEICLELREGDGMRKYYSRHDWIIEDVHGAQHLSEQLAAAAAD